MAVNSKEYSLWYAHTHKTKKHLKTTLREKETVELMKKRMVKFLNEKSLTM